MKNLTLYVINKHLYVFGCSTVFAGLKHWNDDTECVITSKNIRVELVHYNMGDIIYDIYFNRGLCYRAGVRQMSTSVKRRNTTENFKYGRLRIELLHQYTVLYCPRSIRA